MCNEALHVSSSFFLEGTTPWSQTLPLWCLRINHLLHFVGGICGQTQFMDSKSIKNFNSHSINVSQSRFTKTVINLELEERREFNTFICSAFLFGLVTQTSWTMQEFQKLLNKETLFLVLQNSF